MPKSRKPEVVAQEDWDDVDSPEITTAQFALARPVSEVFPGLFDVAPRPRGRPRLANPKIAVKLRLDADVVRAFRETGEGWQTRINEVLKAAKP